MTDMAKVTVVIPAYNEQGAVGEVVASLRQTAPGAHVLVVDDGSGDATAERAAAAGAEVLAHETNRGYGASLASGIRHASSEYVICMDADGQHDPADVLRLAAELQTCDMVVGRRTADSHVDMARRPGKKVLSWFANFLAGQVIPDVNSGLRGFRREVILQYLHLMPRGFSFSTTSTFAMLKSGRRIHWLDIQVAQRVGTSTVRQLRHGPQTLMLMLRLTVLFDPLRIFLPVAGAMLGFAAIMTLLNFLFFRLAVPQTAVFFGLAGIIIFMLGLVTDQVSAIRRELHERP
jgi:glycosyltransferase involved in cell wall biosynthesis